MDQLAKEEGFSFTYENITLHYRRTPAKKNNNNKVISARFIKVKVMFPLHGSRD